MIPRNFHGGILINCLLRGKVPLQCYLYLARVFVGKKKMAAPYETRNGPLLQMYKLKPYLSVDVIELPNMMYKVKNYHTKDHKVSSNISPLASLEKRQEDVLKRLQQLQASLSNLGKKYNVSAAVKPSAPSATISATTSSVTTSAPATRSKTGQSSQDLLHDNRSSACDLVISVDPSSIPLSLVVLCGNLGDHSRVLKSTFVHSSITNNIPDKLRSLLTSNGIKRGDCDLAVNLVWKRVTDGPHLVVDPARQTTIQGEANVARYLARRLGMFTDETDIVTATLIDEILDLAQLQLLEGNSKEKSAAVRTLNSALGKQDWLVGAEPSLADIVCWSALSQTNQTSSPPANVKKWLNLCNQHRVFRAAVDLIG